ncbi:MAG: 6-carboxytetrahydropterin synthase QueD [Armatimonadetes bacterium]|nr:6-carboxytetrahydropterin synthase QueD [Armatimonadota bacterium]
MSRGVYELTVQRHFSAAHALREYKGACSRLHGHNYQVEVVVARDSLDELGMAMDFGELKRICDEVIDGLDHRLLNDLEPFLQQNATSERIAEHVFHEIGLRLQKTSVVLRHVRVWETPTSAATYREE